MLRREEIEAVRIIKEMYVNGEEDRKRCRGVMVSDMSKVGVCEKNVGDKVKV